MRRGNAHAGDSPAPPDRTPDSSAMPRSAYCRRPMEFAYPAEAEAFRAEVRGWLDANLTDEVTALEGSVMDPDPETLERLRDWNRRLADAGYAALSWPAEYGGRGAACSNRS